MRRAPERKLDDIVVFVSVVEHGSFTAAGRHLQMPTSTVSRRVARLEEDLSVQLLRRTTRKLSLTDAGRVYFDHAARSLAELERGELRLADAQGEPRGIVRLTAPLEHSVTMQVVNRYLASYPEVQLEVEFSSRPVNILEAGFDVGLSAGPLVTSSVVAHHLMDSRLVVVGATQYLNRRGRPKRPEDLETHQCVVFGGGRDATRWSFSEYEKAVQVRGPLVVNHLAAALSAVVSGAGIARLPELTAGECIARGEVEVLLANFEPPPVPVWVTHAVGPYQSPAVRALVRLFREHFARMQRSQPALD